VEALLGRGGMGMVYRARDESLDRPVALKLIAPELAQDDGFRARFLKEPRLAASLDHPSVIPIYEAGECAGQLYLVMRYVEGADLRTAFARDGMLSPERVLAVLAQIADALDAAHRRGLVHRDVKPANILLDENGHAYLTDFGITKQLGGDSTDTGRVVGTLDYLAPEQIRGEEVDGRTDCYALACVLYESLAGTPPFRRATEAETLWAHMQEPPAPLPDHPALGPVFERALAKAKEERPTLCSDFIEQAAGALGLAAPPLPGRRVSRTTLLLVAGALLLGAAIVFALTRGLGADRPEAGGPLLDVATNSVGAIDASSGELALAAPLPGRPTDVAAGRETAWVASVDSTAVTGVNSRTGSILRTVPLSGNADAIAVGEGSVWVADARRGLLARIPEGYERVTQRIRFPRSSSAARPSGRLQAPRASLAVGAGAAWLTNRSRSILRIDSQTGDPTRIPIGRPLDGVSASPDGIWAISSGSATVVRVDPRSESPTDRIAIAARPGAEAPVPVAIAATSRAVWVLNANTATVTQIDPRTLGVVTTIPIGVDRVPTDIAAVGGTAWVSNADGSLARIEAGARDAGEIRVGESLERVAAGGTTVWVTTTAFDQKLPGGAG
jgi:streptogramin lyase